MESFKMNVRIFRTSTYSQLINRHDGVDKKMNYLEMGESETYSLTCPHGATTSMYWAAAKIHE